MRRKHSLRARERRIAWSVKGAEWFSWRICTIGLRKAIPSRISSSVRTLAQGLAHFPEGPEAIELMDVSSWMPKALDAAPEAMMAIDAEWRIVVANPKLQRLFNRSKAEL